MTDTKELRRLALLATPGPWEADAPSELHPYKWAVRCPSTPPAISHQLCLLSCINHNEQQDAEYIAAASPSVVLALLDEVETLRNQKASRTVHIVYARWDHEGSSALQAYESEEDADAYAAALNAHKAKEPKCPDGAYEGPDWNAYMERWAAWSGEHPAQLIGGSTADSFDSVPMDVIGLASPQPEKEEGTK